MSTSWTHKGVEITLTSGGEFVAKINGKSACAPSLAAIQKRIDAAQATTFTPFQFIDFDAERFVVGTVVAVTTSGVGRNRRIVFAVEGGERYGSRERRSVTPDTPEARKLVQALREAQRRRDEADEELQKARKAIPTRYADAEGK